MSDGAASLLFILGGFFALALDLLFPFRAAEGIADAERKPTTITPEDR